tara:strand:+ start:555 stop:830 length:276 start_codon:yes stop_codon:yes gene_type:complete
MYYTLSMINNLDFFKKKLLYRASYRGTKEMDILLSSFVNKYISEFDEKQLLELEKFLKYDDEVIKNFYQLNINKNGIEKNKVSLIFKNFKI